MDINPVMIIGGIVVVIFLVIAYLVLTSFVNIGPSEIGLVTKRFGKPLPKG